LQPHLRLITLVHGVRLRDQEGRIPSVCFPLAGMISTVVNLSDGRAVEAAMVGPEGMTDISALGTSISLGDHVVQGPGEAFMLNAAPLLMAMRQSEHVLRMVCLASEVTTGYALQSLACVNYHQLEARFARWVLMARFHMRSDTLHLTHEFLAIMLGSQRSSLSLIAGKLQERGIISYHRGEMVIKDADALASLSCECYESVIKRVDLAFPTRTSKYP
jgi:CRP-like cAMP-binding protein